MKSGFSASTLLLVALLVTGCATKGSVRQMIDSNNDIYDQRIEHLSARINTLENHEANLVNYLKLQNQLLTDFIGQLEQVEPAPVIPNTAH